jgi:hypothetical protein
MRVQRAKLKSCKDDVIIAQGKRSAALGYGPKMIFSFFPSGLARLRAKSEGKKEVEWGGPLPRAAASAALLGYYQAAPLGLRKGEPDAGADSCRPLRLRSRREIRHSQASRSLNPRLLRLSSPRWAESV